MMQREMMGQGDFLTRLDNGSLLVDAAVEKQGWKARLPGATRRALHPGSTIRFEDQLFEIESASVENGRFSYRLIPWDPAFAVRAIFEYSAEEIRHSATRRKAQGRYEKQSGLLILIGPLIGLLPSADQFRLESEYSTPAVRNTTLSAILVFIPTSVVLAIAITDAFGGPNLLPESILKWSPLLIYLCFESMFRGIVSAKVQHPLGSLPVVLPIETFRAIADIAHPERRKQRRDQRGISQRSHPVWNQAEDRIRSSEDHDGRLEIVSLLAKPHWTAHRMGIRFRDKLYFLADRQSSGEGRQIRHRFTLEEASPHQVFPTVVLYEPDEVRDLHRNIEIEKRRIWAETFAPVWGLLEADLQEKLKRIYGHEALRQARASALFLLLAGVLGLLLAIRNVITGIGGAADLGVGILATLTLLESFDRLEKIRKGVVASSWLGILLRPLARALLIF